MNRPRNQLILLGFLCQAWTWDNYLLPAASGALWFLCLAVRKPVRVGPAAEGALLAFGCAAALGLGAAVGQNTHFFIGHGLTVLQAVRLMRPLNRTEQILSIVIALLQVGVGCAAILDYRIVLILLLAAVVVPKTLVELAAYNFAPGPALGIRPARGTTAAVLASMVVFFLVFPRAFLASPFQARSFQRGAEGTLADYVLDPSRSSSLLSGRVIMQVEGQDLGYLRYLALVNFDGLRWTGERSPGVKRIPYVPRSQLAGFPLRRVQVKQVGVLGRVLPADGRVVQLEGTFFRRPLRNSYDIIECDALWNTRNNVYEYWIDPDSKPDKLARPQLERYLKYPAQSARLRRWLDETLDGIADPLQQARKLEAWLRDNLEYQRGAPELNRVNPIDDFLFQQRQGHCERFAAALALLLRLQEIPSRVVIGYVPGGRNWFSGRYNIRFRDAHAWTEAYFDDLGWVQLDGTPRATIPLASSTIGDLIETLDSFWYSNIVNFDVPAQKQMFGWSLELLAKLPAWAHRHRLWLPGLLLGLLVLVLWRRRRPQRQASGSRTGADIRMQNFYGRMLRALARQGFHRQPCQSPLEFARQLKAVALPALDDIDRITVAFCQARYGHRSLSPAEQGELEQALGRITQCGRDRPPKTGRAAG